MASSPSPRMAWRCQGVEASIGRIGSSQPPSDGATPGVMLPYQVWKAYGRTDSVSLGRMLPNNLIVERVGLMRRALKIPSFIAPNACFFPALLRASFLTFWLLPENERSSDYL